MNSFSSFPARIILRENPALLAESIVDCLENDLMLRLEETTPKPIGFATGRTMLPVYSSLVSRLLKWPASRLEKLLKGWLSFNLDEYVGLNASDLRSFKSYMGKHFAGPLGLNFERIRIPDSNALHPINEANSYVKNLINAGGIGIQMLGLGSNGHVGFNEPPCKYDISCRVQSLSEQTRQQNAFAFGDRIENVPLKAITLGLKEILAADKIHLVVTGISKREILNKFLTSTVSESLPVSWLRKHNNVSLWVDKDAFSEINI
tara:strand:+ start:1091 stop:1876 length:786 start_codon:yes stop_codon:yes gene_type:complete